MIVGDSNIAFPINWVVLLPVITGFLAVCYLLPTPKSRPLVNGILAIAAAVAGFATFLFRGLGTDWPCSTEMFLFGAFSLVAFTFAILMITQRNPARASLYFSVVVLSVCGLFLLLAAPFLMAATIIIYAGAIIVTFLFVIMLSQQSGQTDANDRSREPSLAAAVGFIILAALLVVLQRVYVTTEVDELLRQTDRHARSETVDESLKGPARAKRYLDDLVRVREKLGYGQVEIPTEINGTPRREKDSDPIEDLRDALGLNPPVFSPAPGQASDREARLNVAEINNAAAQIHYELAYLKAVRDGRIKPAAGVELSPYGRSLTPSSGDPAEAKFNRLPNANIAALGRTLFTDHMLAIELGGTLLLVATIGAIAIAGSRSEKSA